MKKLLLLVFLFPITLISQSYVPSQYWLDDSNYEKVINKKDTLERSKEEIIVVEYWAEFNEKNCFSSWPQLKNTLYYRIDIAKSPIIYKKYGITTVPTLLIIKNGEIKYKYSAGINLQLPITLEEIQNDINGLIN